MKRFAVAWIVLIAACRVGDEPSPVVETDPSETAGSESDSPGTDASDSGTPPTESEPVDTSEVETVPWADYSAELDALCVNEFMPGNAFSFDFEGMYWDWIEIHNQDSVAITLDGWSLSDDEASPNAFVFPTGTQIEAGAYVLWHASGDVALGPNHLPFSLDQDGEQVALFAPNLDGEVVTFEAVTDDVAAHRSTDCCVDCWVTAWAGTPGSSNNP